MQKPFLVVYTDSKTGTGIIIADKNCSSGETYGIAAAIGETVRQGRIFMDNRKSYFGKGLIFIVLLIFISITGVKGMRLYKEVSGPAGISVKDARITNFKDTEFEKMVMAAMEIGEIAPEDLKNITHLTIRGNYYIEMKINSDDSENSDMWEKTYIWEQKSKERGNITGLLDLRLFPLLEGLTVTGNKIQSLEGVEACPGILELDLSDNEIHDIQGLAEMTGLQILNMAENRIADLSALQKLQKINTLYLQNNEIKIAAPLKNLKNLKTLYIQNNPAGSIRVLEELPLLRELDYQNTDASAGYKFSYYNPYRGWAWKDMLYEVHQSAIMYGKEASKDYVNNPKLKPGRPEHTYSALWTVFEQEEFITVVWESRQSGFDSFGCPEAEIYSAKSGKLLEMADLFREGDYEETLIKAIVDTGRMVQKDGIIAERESWPEWQEEYTVSGADGLTGFYPTAYGLVFQYTAEKADGGFSDDIFILVDYRHLERILNPEYFKRVLNTLEEERIPIVWKEAAVEKAVRRYLSRPEGDIYEKELEGIQRILVDSKDNSYNEIKSYMGDPSVLKDKKVLQIAADLDSLEDIRYFKGLKGLHLYVQTNTDLSFLEEEGSDFLKNQLTDFSLCAYGEKAELGFLGKYTKLRFLELWSTEIKNSDLRPVSACTALEWLTLMNCNIWNIYSLEKLSKLNRLNMGMNQCSDLTPLAHCRNLNELLAYDNLIENIEPLRYCTKLIKLDIMNTRTDSIEALKNCWEMKVLNLTGCPVSDIEPLRYMNKLVSVDLRSTDIITLTGLENAKCLESVLAGNAQLYDISTLSNCTNLIEVRLESNHIRDISVIAKCPKLKYVDLDNNPIQSVAGLEGAAQIESLTLYGCDIEDITPLSGCLALKVLDLCHNQRLTDVSPLMGLKNLEWLRIYNTGIQDLRPLAHCPKLKNIEK